MGTDKVGIANMALRKVGAKRISSFNDPTSEAKNILEVYDLIRDEVLAEAPWTFAIKRVVLTTLSGTPVMTEDGMRIIYARPNDLIQVFFTNIPGATYKLEENGILSDTANLKIAYVYRHDDPTKYTAMFITALSTRLASEICFNLTQSVAKAKELFKEYEELRLPSAKAKDAQQGTPIQAIQDEWDNARLMGGNNLYAQPGQQTWIPTW